jgi:uncharacterized membrane protein
MDLRIQVTFVFIIMLLPSPVLADTTATVHGAVYEWYSFELLEDAIIEVNSTPPQTIVAKYGLYSMELEPGTYKIVAGYYNNRNLESSTEEIITIESGGDYVVDLLLYPAYEETYDDDFMNMTEALEEGTALLEEENEETASPLIYAIPVLLAIAFAGLYMFRKKNRKTENLMEPAVTEENEDAVSAETEMQDENPWENELPEDLRKIIDIIRSNGGRITQRELRREVDYSESKVSLMISDLENRGIISKFKKGRGNVLILRDPE